MKRNQRTDNTSIIKNTSAFIAKNCQGFSDCESRFKFVKTMRYRRVILFDEAIFGAKKIDLC